MAITAIVACGGNEPEATPSISTADIEPDVNMTPVPIAVPTSTAIPKAASARTVTLIPIRASSIGISVDEKPFSGIALNYSMLTGKKVLEFQIENGKKNGYYNEWYLNGKKKVQYNYKNNLMHGRYTKYYQNDTL